MKVGIWFHVVLDKFDVQLFVVVVFGQALNVFLKKKRLSDAINIGIHIRP